jgi:hypothetical protein
MQVPPSSSSFHYFAFNYSLQHPQFMLFTYRERPSFTPIENAISGEYKVNREISTIGDSSWNG